MRCLVGIDEERSHPPILRSWFGEPPNDKVIFSGMNCQQGSQPTMGIVIVMIMVIVIIMVLVIVIIHLSSEAGLVSLQMTRLSPAERTANKDPNPLMASTGPL